MPKSKYLSVKYIAKHFKVTERTVYNWIRLKKIPAHKNPLSKKWFILRTDFDVLDAASGGNKI